MELVAPGFDDSAALLKVLIFATATIFIGNLFGNTVVAIGRQLTMMWVYLGVAVISLVGYLVFIPRYSYFGAAGMTVVSELLVTLAALLIVSLATRAWPSPVVFMKSAAACVIMAIVLYGAAGTNLFMQIALGGVTYVVTLLMLRGVSARDLREIVRSGE
ncbi:MAG: polysaccharide biosynthesis C-terminal domain-containing protein [Patescibacteria group bacterium]